MNSFGTNFCTKDKKAAEITLRYCIKNVFIIYVALTSYTSTLILAIKLNYLHSFEKNLMKKKATPWHKT